ncbi:MAG: hypothetical protein PHE88_10200 [Elusimicrobia bacterium]|nr:hypothetical protein [Elusimicrobiota bacterium]
MSNVESQVCSGRVPHNKYAGPTVPHCFRNYVAAPPCGALIKYAKGRVLK